MDLPLLFCSDMKGMFYAFGILCLAMGFGLGWIARGCSRASGGGAVYADTVTVVDSMPCYYPVPRDSAVVRYETVRLRVADTSLVTVRDTVRVADSVQVVVPITQKMYADSTYRAYVSGYNPRLDSIFVYAPTKYVTTVVKEKPKRWAIGVQAGCGYSRGGISPYVGIGVSYNLYSF